MKKNLADLNDQITSCKKCPRLVEYIDEIREKFPSYWCKPVPSFGDVKAKILIVGLAPGRFGSNRTGRMFTGDSSGNFMYPILHEVGLCNQPDSIDINDGFKLKDCYITAVGRCAPPQNKPTPEELNNCFPYLGEELKLLKDLKVVVALGKIAFDGYIKWAISARHCEEVLKEPTRQSTNAIRLRSLSRAERGISPRNDVLQKKDFKFSHGAIYEKGLPHILIASYHPSRQNTQTGRLTKAMFKKVFEIANEYVREN
jgi:uracil-DNA glycosylase family 4